MGARLGRCREALRTGMDFERLHCERCAPGALRGRRPSAWPCPARRVFADWQNLEDARRWLSESTGTSALERSGEVIEGPVSDAHENRSSSYREYRVEATRR